MKYKTNYPLIYEFSGRSVEKRENRVYKCLQYRH